jgi:hypothetical protein
MGLAWVAVERMMKLQEVICRALAGSLTWLQAADILGLDPRTVRLWRARYQAARGIRERFGADKAMGYLIGEKFLNFLQASDQHPEFASELPRFVAEVKQIFEPREIRAHLDGVSRVGALGHTASDKAVERPSPAWPRERPASCNRKTAITWTKVYPLFTRMCRTACVHAARRRRRLAVAFWTLSSRYS